jgi:preprotein translocase subunit SecA
LPFSREVRGINRFEPALSRLSDAELKRRSRGLQYRVRSGEPPAMLVCEAFALAREAARRAIGLRHFDVQLAGGLAMFRGGVAEMQTGEGKTLTATLPLYLHALRGRGAHLITANDYLARRDADWMRPAFELLGLSVGVLQSDSTRAARLSAYRRDVTYGTIREFGFDFLRDRLSSLRVRRPSEAVAAAADRFDGLGRPSYDNDERPLQRPPYFALVDEADNILIDEARTPLIISAQQSSGRVSRDALFRWGAAATTGLAADVDFVLDLETRTAALTEEGRRAVRDLPRDAAPASANLLDLFEAAERAVAARELFRRDREYLVRDGEVVLIDASTGRPAEGRKLRRGLHQAIEAQEDVAITAETNAAAQVTVQTFVRRYEHLAGMTGTARAAAGELRRSYRLRVRRIPTNRPLRRRRLPTVVVGTESDKWDRVVREVGELTAGGRPVLIGTRSVKKSDELSRRLSDAGIPHQVLNARELAKEADVVADAGRAGRVTVATNMAGRGTDIRLDDDARDAGGLHVLSTEKHDAERIDRQLLGRCGRQGDPGTFQEILSLEDGVLKEGLTPAERQRLVEHARTRGLPKIPGFSSTRFFRLAQRRLERRHSGQRKQLMRFEQLRMQRERELGLDYFLEVSD